MSEEWSQWLDFDKAAVEAVPEAAGVCVMHASMKVLFIGGSQNIKKTLAERLSDECTGKAKRFRYMLTQSPDSVKEQMLKEYAEKHGGKMPLCM
jgi:hypothetical protein